MKRYTLRLIYFIISQKLEFCNTHRTNFKFNSHYVNLINMLDTTKQEALLLYLVNIAIGKSDLCYKTECLKIINRYPRNRTFAWFLYVIYSIFSSRATKLINQSLFWYSSKQSHINSDFKFRTSCLLSEGVSATCQPYTNG